MNYNQPWLYAMIAGLFLALALLERLGPVSIREEAASWLARYRMRHLRYSRERMATGRELVIMPSPIPETGTVRVLLPPREEPAPVSVPEISDDTPLDPLPALPGPQRLMSADARTEQLAALRTDCEYCGEDHTGDCEKSLLARALRRRGVHPGSIAFEEALGRPVSYVTAPAPDDTITGMEPPQPRPPVRVHPGEQVRIELPPPPAIPEVDLLEDYDADAVAAQIRASYDQAEAEQLRRIDEAEQLSRQIWAAEHPAAS
jgi:hypothetical protein